MCVCVCVCWGGGGGGGMSGPYEAHTSILMNTFSRGSVQGSKPATTGLGQYGGLVKHLTDEI